MLEAVLDLAARAPSPQNSQPWRWQVDDAGLHLHADWSRAVADSGAGRRDVLISCGAVLDHCAVALAAEGWRPHVRRFPMPDDPGHIALFDVIEHPAQPGHRELAAAIGSRRSDRREFPEARLPAGTLELLSVHAARRGVDFAVVPRTRWGRDERGEVALRFPGRAVGDRSANADGAVLLTLGTAGDDEIDRVRAGETLSHLLLAATALELASCALTDPLHDGRNRLALGCEVFDGESYPQALIRVGTPPDTPQPPGGSDRRTLQQTTTWASN
ncbi:nitroreductase [Mycolicibacterium poriferae]|uniref:nitroreductase n=1 Tax=Mycolicibacterium poriferae TaxID=39694 RepID=UPI0024BA012A|nr:nitroreductase [Mycolicibacterium poriferae]